MKALKVIIVDDEPLAHKVLEGYCEKIEGITVVANCYDGISTINYLNNNEVDLILLDIQMPDISGIELLDNYKNIQAKVIFTTAYTEYAMVSFDYDQVVDYLHKPIRLTRFIRAIERVRKLLRLENDSDNQSNSIEQAATPQTEYINLKDNKTIYRIKLENILYIQSWGNYLKFFLDSDEIKIVRKTIKELDRELPAAQFQRIHKSYLVNKKHVKALVGNQVKIEDQHLPIGKSYLIESRKNLMS